MLALYHIIIVLFLVMCGILSCAKPLPRNNPVDAHGSAYLPPSITIKTGPAINDTVKGSSVTFVWEKNQPEVVTSYYLTGRGWSSWSRDTSALFPYLDDGRYEFILVYKYDGMPPDTLSSVFFINMSKPGFLYTVPRYIETGASQTDSFSILVKTTDSLALFHIALSFNADSLKVSRITTPFDTSSSASLFYEYRDPGLVIELLLGPNFNYGAGISGDQKLCTIYFQTDFSGEMDVEISPTSRLWNNKIQPVTIAGTVGMHIK